MEIEIKQEEASAIKRREVRAIQIEESAIKGGEGKRKKTRRKWNKTSREKCNKTEWKVQ